jgi:hypothetical protein
MARVGRDDQRLVLQYHNAEKGQQIPHRENLADELGITIENLRKRACLIRGDLEKCLKRCLKRAENARPGS